MTLSPRDRVRARIIAAANLPADIEEQVFSLGCDPLAIERLVRESGLAEADSCLRSIAESRQLHKEWGPRLRAFAAERRLEKPVPSLGQLTQKQRAKAQIVASHVEAELPRVGNLAVSVYIMPLYAMGSISAEWMKSGDVVLLTDEEDEQWCGSSSQLSPHEPRAWCERHWFAIHDPPGEYDFPEPRDFPAGIEPWVVVQGSLGGDYADLWLWDGVQASFSEHLYASTYTY